MSGNKAQDCLRKGGQVVNTSPVAEDGQLPSDLAIHDPKGARCSYPEVRTTLIAEG